MCWLLLNSLLVLDEWNDFLIIIISSLRQKENIFFIQNNKGWFVIFKLDSKYVLLLIG